MRSMLRTLRYWIPIVAGCGCLISSMWVSPIIGWLLIMAAFTLLLEAATAGFARAGRTGNLGDHRQ